MYSSASVSNTNRYISALPIISIIEIFVIFLIERHGIEKPASAVHLYHTVNAGICCSAFTPETLGGGSLWPTRHALHDCLLLSSLQNLPCTRWENKAGTAFDLCWRSMIIARILKLGHFKSESQKKKKPTHRLYSNK